MLENVISSAHELTFSLVARRVSSFPDALGIFDQLNSLNIAQYFACHMNFSESHLWYASGNLGSQPGRPFPAEYN
jgi:hypothetical protein